MAGFHLFIKTQALKTHIKTKVKSQSHPELKLEPQNLTNCLSQKFKTLYLKKTDRMKFREMLKNDNMKYLLTTGLQEMLTVNNYWNQSLQILSAIF